MYCTSIAVKFLKLRLQVMCEQVKDQYLEDEESNIKFLESLGLLDLKFLFNREGRKDTTEFDKARGVVDSLEQQLVYIIFELIHYLQVKSIVVLHHIRRLHIIVIIYIRIGTLLQQKSYHARGIIVLRMVAGIVQRRLPRRVPLIDVGSVGHAEFHAHECVGLRSIRASMQRCHLIVIKLVQCQAECVENHGIYRLAPFC